MSCSYCPQPAQAKCACSRPYMCQVHLGPHLLTLRNHSYETLDLNLENKRLVKLRSKILKEVQKINKVKDDISLKTKTLIKLTETVFKMSLAKLDTFNNTYLGLLKQNKFSKSDLETIQKIENMDLSVMIVCIGDIKRQLEIDYSQEFVEYEANESDLKIKFLNKHAGGLFCGAVTSDGSMLVTGGSDSVVRVWSLSQSKQIFALHGHNSDICCLTLTPDSQNIITGSYDASVRTWNINRKSQTGIFKGHNEKIQSICYLDRSSSVISSDYSSAVLIWDFLKLTIIRKITDLTRINSFILTKNQLCLIAGLNPKIVFYELESGSVVKEFNDHSGAVLSTCLTNNEKIMVSGSDDNSIIVWDINKSKKTKKLTGHTSRIYSLALTSDEKLIISGSSDKTVRVWSIETGTERNQFNHSSFVYCILRVKSGFYSLSEDSSIGQFDIESGSFKINRFLKPFKSDSISFKSELGLIAYGSKNEAAIWDNSKEVESLTLIGHQDMVFCVEISRDSRFIISGSRGSEKNLIYWSLETGQKIADLAGHTSTVFCACFSKNGLNAASGSADKTVRTWNLREIKQEHEFDHGSSILSIKFLDFKRMLVSGGDDRKVIIWNLIDKSQYAVLSGHNQKIWKVLVTDNEKFIISCSVYDGIRVWNLEAKQEFAFSYQEEAASLLSENRIELNQLKRYLKA